MKVFTASLALLGLPAALAAVAATHSNAAPTRPDLAVNLPAASPQPATYGELIEDAKQKPYETGSDSDYNNWHDLLRRRSPDATPPLHNTFTHVNKTTSTGAATEVAAFTADGAVFTVTGIAQTYAVDGKTLVPGAPAQLIAGESISEGTKGNVVVNGQTLVFTPVASSSAPAPPPASSTSASAQGSSSSGSAGQAASSTTSGGHAPGHTAAGFAVGVVGAVIGVMVL